MENASFPRDVPNWIGGRECVAKANEWLEKVNPATSEVLARAVRSRAVDVEDAVAAAVQAQPGWAATPAVQRGMVLNEIVVGLKEHHEQIARVVALETGKPFRDAFAETAGAIALGLFFASEGQRLYGRTSTSSFPYRYALTVRQPVGVAGLIVPANTPIANVTWKVFPALVCGNAAVLKAAEDAPATAWLFGQIAHGAGLPPGVLNVIQGFGEEAGAPLVECPAVGVISFTGSTEVGRAIQQKAGARFARVSLELGGKNPLVVCDDADLDRAAHWVTLSAFSNAGQRCASASRIIVFAAVYARFRGLLVERASHLRVGTSEDDDFGPVINERQLTRMLAAIEAAKERGARVLVGGHRLTDEAHRRGFFMAPTILEEVSPDDEISRTELFGPITCLYRAVDFSDALRLANDSPYGLTACIHTRSVDRAMAFAERVQAGVAVVNGGTFGSEPHMPFGGLKASGNGTREPGTEALDVYSVIKDVYVNIDPQAI
jgi:aldehyde dehydrogenase (NAD+)